MILLYRSLGVGLIEQGGQKYFNHDFYSVRPLLRT